MIVLAFVVGLIVGVGAGVGIGYSVAEEDVVRRVTEGDE